MAAVRAGHVRAEPRTAAAAKHRPDLAFANSGSPWQV